MFDFNDPFYKPLWLRILIVAVCTGFSLLEFNAGSSFLGMLFASLTVVTLWGLFINFNPRDTREK
jgi:hypothetical protein